MASDSGSLFEDSEIDLAEKQPSFIIEAKEIANAEVRETKSLVDGEIKGFSKTERKIVNSIKGQMQKNTRSLDIAAIENEAISNVNKKIKKLGIELDHFDKHKYMIAIFSETNKILKKKINKRFKFTLEEILDISGMQKNNIYHLKKVLKKLRAEERYRIQEQFIDFDSYNPNDPDNSLKIRFADLEVPFFGAMGTEKTISKEESIELINNGADKNDPIDDILDNIDLSSKDTFLIIEIDESILPYHIGFERRKHFINNAYSNQKKHFIFLNNNIMGYFNNKHTEHLYRICELYVIDPESKKDLYLSDKFSFKELQKRFRTTYGVEAEVITLKVDINKCSKLISDEAEYVDPKNDRFIIKKIKKETYAYYNRQKKFLIDPKTNTFEKVEKRKDKSNQIVYRTDEKGNYVYEENYHTKYKDFKKFVLVPAMDEINSGKSPYIVNLKEYRESNRLRYVQFAIALKEKHTPDNLRKYNSLGYYATLIIDYINMHQEKERIKNLNKHSKKLDESFEKGEFNITIGDIKSLEELKMVVSRNNEAILKIKEIIANNIPELINIRFDENYLVLRDISANKNRFGEYKRIGSNAIDGLKWLYDNFEKDYLENNKKLTLEDFIPFDYYDEIEEKFIRVNKDNIDNYRVQINTSIEMGSKKSFKAFKATYGSVRETKNKFYTLFFKEN